MSEVLINKVLSKLGFLCLEHHSEGYFSCIGEPPPWAIDLFPCVRNRFPRILPIDISPFLENFMVDAVEFWPRNNAAVLRSGYWTESTTGSFFDASEELNGEVHLEAIALTVDSTPLVLLEVSEVKFVETFNWLQTAREDRLDSMVERKLSASQMANLSLFDPLTGLLNEQAFVIQVSQWIEQVRREALPPFLLIRLNIDGFRHLSFTLGRDASDQYLIQFARRLKLHLGSQDGVARLGADEFGLLVRCPDGTTSEQWLEMLRTSLRSPYRINTEEIYTTVSLGVVKVEDSSQDAEQRLSNALLALSQAKDDGRGQCRIFDEQWRVQKRNHLQLEQWLLQCIVNRQLKQLYRPLFNARTRQVVGCEVILDWPDADCPATGLQQVAQATGLLTHLSIYQLESCVLMLRDRPTNSPLILLCQSPIQALFDPNFSRALDGLHQQIEEGDRVILKLTGLNAEAAVDGLESSFAKLQSLKIEPCVQLHQLKTMPHLSHLSHYIQVLAIDPSRHVLNADSEGNLEHPDLMAWDLQAATILSENLDCESHEQAIASLRVDICAESSLAEPRSIEAFRQLFMETSNTQS